MAQTPHCQEQDAFLAFEKQIIEKFLEGHYPFSSIEKQILVAGFIKNHAADMRKTYCDYICPCRGNCPLLKDSSLLRK